MTWRRIGSQRITFGGTLGGSIVADNLELAGGYLHGSSTILGTLHRTGGGMEHSGMTIAADSRWDSGELAATFQPKVGPVSHAVLSPKGRYIAATGTMGGTVWPIETTSRSRKDRSLTHKRRVRLSFLACASGYCEERKVISAPFLWTRIGPT